MLNGAYVLYIFLNYFSKFFYSLILNLLSVCVFSSELDSLNVLKKLQKNNNPEFLLGTGQFERPGQTVYSSKNILKSIQKQTAYQIISTQETSVFDKR